MQRSLIPATTTPLFPSVRFSANALHLGDAHPEPVSLRLPLIASPCPQAGFPSPAADYVEETLDLNELLIRNPPATFFVRVQGESMVDAKIFEGDVLAVDRSIDTRPGSIVVATYAGDIYVKRLAKLAGGRLALVSENAAQRDQYPILYLDQAEDCTLWGVVTGSVRRF
ncbi:translesion error-prone DNA polymerase V autoproteolytic subunit [Flagellatimonas centrodinii]|uniref:LexA family protein n=1 Tax=Flagellatimonas centrodinii TaxID=2806210 RepID=UPI001FEFB66E|nr:translesion error-prone DNA polymerase V autoproteolytic subunit [Flagellatimonas centrodinii]ULQ46305.1 translesion error-prone DNA polymerase V autoproteolytic subunit [Flagellatimonas centrodinii]